MAVRLTLAGRIALERGDETVCQARISGPDAIRIATTVRASDGQAVLCHLDGLGVIPGRVGAARTTGFVLVPDLCEVRRTRIEARLAWLARLAVGHPDQRETPRVVPVHRAVTVRLSDGACTEGQVEDLSKSGARISLPLSVGGPFPWQPGLQVTVGKRYAIVVRVEDGAIAVRFRLPFTDETFNPSVVL